MVEAVPKYALLERERLLVADGLLPALAALPAPRWVVREVTAGRASPGASLAWNGLPAEEVDA